MFRTPSRIPSNTNIGRPPRFGHVFNMSGGTETIIKALAARFVPWRAMERATSPPPVE
ncbi:hypothetical protein BSU04_01820 [Caballeronia sordidicola]|uniref:Uncharacterized protein n=1 Tax=Caballeronia sordidicola TaxID=196367 RepID=A0A226XA88_CABSO|nr:hypothetical protein BSU04_01820 [Caballeronia sordidicola]